MRRAAGKTQQDVADVVGVTWQQIGKYERGKDCISASRREQIIEYLTSSSVAGFEERQSPYLPPAGGAEFRLELEEAARELNSGIARLNEWIRRQRA